MEKIILKGFIIVPEQALAQVKKALPQHIRLTRNEPGCLVFSVVQCENQPTRFDVYEEFRNQAAFDIHQKRVHSSAWGQITVNVERHYTIHKVAIV